jgi:hypothetical protein
VTSHAVELEESTTLEIRRTTASRELTIGA